jgi:signal transduction histidine kinase
MLITGKNKSIAVPPPPVNPPNPSERLDIANIHTMELFFGMFAHELRSQLSGIVGASRYALEEKRNNFYLRAIHTISLNTLHVLDNMLTTVKVNVGKLDIRAEKEPFGLKNWIKTFIQPLEDMASIQRQDICLTIHPSIERAIINTDQIKMGQILQNLLTNALKFSYTGTCIALKCYSRDAGLTIEVMNQGIDIPYNKLDCLFKPYEQLDSGFAGTGLGLYLSWLYAQALGGTLTVQSDKGSTIFTVYIPDCIHPATISYH